MKKTIGFIGAGNMGGAIIKGIIASGIDARNIIVYDKNTDAQKALCDECGATNAKSIKDACLQNVVILAVKPNVIYSVIEEIKDIINKDAVIISIAAGQTMEKLTNAFGYGKIKLARVMPNTPALVGEGMSAVCFNEVMKNTENKEDADLVVSLFESVGRAEVVSEALMDAVTGVSGSSPAYVFMLIEAMADAAVLGGMPRAQAYTFAAQAVLGSAKMVLGGDKHPGELKDMVCSPGGTTIEAVKVLEEKGFRSAVMDAIDACIKKSKSM